MKQSETAPGALDEAVRVSLVGLEKGKERLALIAQADRELHGRIQAELTSIEQELEAQGREFGGLEARIVAARQRVDQIMGGALPDPATLMTAVQDLAEAKAQLSIGRERQESLLRHAQSLRSLLPDLNTTACDGEKLVTELGNGLAFLRDNFQALGSHLESAQQSRALGLHVIRAQEEERRRLAREIHDGPTQLLNSVVLRIDVCQRFFDSDLPRLRDELQQLKELVRLSLQDVRKIIFDLRPMTLDDLGLVPALRTYLKDYQSKTGIETDLAVFGRDRRYDSVFEVAVFRIVQEALTNVSKHAGATRVWVKVETTGGREIKVSIRDDGVGFEPSKVQPGVSGSRFGLVAMRERCELLGGTMDIKSTPGHGTRLNFLFAVAE